MIGSTRDRRGHLLASAAALVLLLAGCGAPEPAPSDTPASPSTSAATTAARPSASPVATAAPSPTSAAPSSSEAATPTESVEPSVDADEPAMEAEETLEAEPTKEAAPAGPEVPEALGESFPVSFSIPRIETGSDLLRLLLSDDGSLAVPPADPGSPAAWYANSPTPGERGPAVLLGHVNEKDGSDGIFARLPELEPGDEIEVRREDGTTAVFTVDRGQKYDKGEFPTDEVYGNTAGPELRLITCDGYNIWTRTFEENYIVFATFTGVR